MSVEGFGKPRNGNPVLRTAQLRPFQGGAPQDSRGTPTSCRVLRLRRRRGDRGRPRPGKRLSPSHQRTPWPRGIRNRTARDYDRTTATVVIARATDGSRNQQATANPEASHEASVGAIAHARKRPDPTCHADAVRRGRRRSLDGADTLQQSHSPDEQRPNWSEHRSFTQYPLAHSESREHAAAPAVGPSGSCEPPGCELDGVSVSGAPLGDPASLVDVFPTQPEASALMSMGSQVCPDAHSASPTAHAAEAQPLENSTTSVGARSGRQTSPSSQAGPPGSSQFLSTHPWAS